MPLPAGIHGQKRILLPLNLTNGSPEAFGLVNRAAEFAEVMVVLLHVVHLNIAESGDRVYAELACEAQARLAHLALSGLHPRARSLLRVRFGQPAQQIAAEARAQAVNLIVLSSGSRAPFWTRLAPCRTAPARVVLSRLARKIIRAAPCDILLVGARSEPDLAAKASRVQELCLPQGAGA